MLGTRKKKERKRYIYEMDSTAAGVDKTLLMQVTVTTPEMQVWE
jgi:hypothetical protein